MSATTARSTRRRVAAILTAVGGVIVLAGCSSTGRDLSAESLPTPTAPLGTDGGSPPTSPPDPGGRTTDADDPAEPVDDEAENAADASDDSSGYPDGGGQGHDQDDDDGGGQGGELEPFGDGGAAPGGPCDDVLATGAALLVTPAPAVLPSGTMSSTLTVTNCADEAVDWTADTVPTVALANGGGNLSPGSSSELAFTIDSDAYEPGAVTFKIKISEPGHNHYVDVHAFRELVGSDFVGTLGLTAGEGAGGCANQCIVSGKVTGNFTTPNVTLEVGLNTAAMITAWVSQQPPVEVDGHPAFPGMAPTSASVIAQTAWSTTLEPLQPDTEYHLVVAATDEFEHTSYRSGSFVTTTPVELPDDLASPDGPAGCYAQCITTALVTPLPTSTDMTLHVESHTEAIFDVWVSTDAPDLGGAEPAFAGDVEKAATTDGLSVTSWDATLGELTTDTDYHIVLRAMDLQGGRSFRVGTFRTGGGPRVRAQFRSVAIVGDGDDSELWNPGELSFAWGFNDVMIGSRGEEKIGLNNAFLLPAELSRSSFTFTDTGSFIPTLYISAAERDPDGIAEFCAMGQFFPRESDRDESCDLKWTVASSGLITTDSFDDMPRCSQFELFEVAEQPCLVLESEDRGGDWPRFWAIVSFEFVDA